MVSRAKDFETFQRKKPQNRKIQDSFEFESLQIKKGQSFQDYIFEIRHDKDRYEDGKWIRNDELAKRLGLSVDMCTKILNRQKDNQSRDCVIAICVALEMSVPETDKALRLYGYRGLADQDERDVCVMSVLDNNVGAKKGEWIEHANRFLREMGHDELNVVNHRDSSKKSGREKKRIAKPKPNPAFEVLDTRFSPTIYADPFDSMSTAWNPDRFEVDGRMTLLEKKTGAEYRLSAQPSGVLSLYDTRGDSGFRRFGFPEEAGEFREYFEYLSGVAKTGSHRLKKHLDDTRNYYMRAGANVRGDSIHVFVERYNYELSERHEFYLMEYEGGEYRLSVFHESAFMSRYLGEKRYKIEYGKEAPVATRTYASAEVTESETEDRRISRFREKAFSDLAVETEKIIGDLRNGRLRVRNWATMLDYPDEVCRIFKVEKEFACEMKFLDPNEDKEIESETTEEVGWPFYSAGLEQADFPTEDGSVVTVTLKQLKRAFDLGYKDIGQICRILKEYGTVEAILK